jgi:hypothetical protein
MDSTSSESLASGSKMNDSPPVLEMGWKDLFDSWTEDSFLYVINLTKKSPSQGRVFFLQYSWEVFDRVFEYSLSTSCCLENLLSVVKLLADSCRPRELYMMAVEKVGLKG